MFDINLIDINHTVYIKNSQISEKHEAFQGVHKILLIECASHKKDNPFVIALPE